MPRPEIPEEFVNVWEEKYDEWVKANSSEVGALAMARDLAKRIYPDLTPADQKELWIVGNWLDIQLMQVEGFESAEQRQDCCAANGQRCFYHSDPWIPTFETLELAKQGRAPKHGDEYAMQLHAEYMEKKSGEHEEN